MVNVMADHVDDDVCSYTGKPNSSSSLKPIDSQRIDSQQINNAISITSEVSIHFRTHSIYFRAIALLPIDGLARRPNGLRLV